MQSGGIVLIIYIYIFGCSSNPKGYLQIGEWRKTCLSLPDGNVTLEENGVIRPKTEIPPTTSPLPIPQELSTTDATTPKIAFTLTVHTETLCVILIWAAFVGIGFAVGCFCLNAKTFSRKKAHVIRYIEV
ncbi:hypothetical protein L596_019277 [Steinernema carpocapsae]|uniref:Uncharacterized protein n=1 Tax=Steinernema carpocapsae TaxID=34508 RepID=A0A4U5MQ70_STECR|nr:hypothetical protein L596_019277 [Steinernema carpocapsae]